MSVTKTIRSPGKTPSRRGTASRSHLSKMKSRASSVSRPRAQTIHITLPESQPQKESTNWVWVWALLAVLVVLFLCLLGYILLRKKPSQTDPKVKDENKKPSEGGTITKPPRPHTDTDDSKNDKPTNVVVLNYIPNYRPPPPRRQNHYHHDRPSNGNRPESTGSLSFLDDKAPNINDLRSKVENRCNTYNSALRWSDFGWKLYVTSSAKEVADFLNNAKDKRALHEKDCGLDPRDGEEFRFWKRLVPMVEKIQKCHEEYHLAEKIGEPPYGHPYSEWSKKKVSGAHEQQVLARILNGPRR